MRIKSSFVRAALPSLGFFGGTWADNLEVHGEHRVLSLTVQRIDKREDFLNFRGLILKNEHKYLQLADDEFHISYSSIREREASLGQDIRKQVAFHSKKEQNPWWKVEFREPVDVDTVLLFNRGDALGSRSRNLRITIVDDSGRECVVYDSGSREFFDETLAVIEKFAGNAVSNCVVSNIEQAQKWRTDTVRALANSLRQGTAAPTKLEWIKLASLLPSRRGVRLGSDLEGDDWFLLAYGMCLQVHRDPRSRSGIQAYADVLNSVERLKRLEVEFQAVSRALGTEKMYHHVRHGISLTTSLSESSAELSEQVARLEEFLARRGEKIFLAYGSLLGAVRDGALLPHDDDFDVFLPIEAASIEEFRERKQLLYRELAQEGWLVRPVKNYHNGHVSLPEFSSHIDVFAVWIDGNRAWTHMEKMTWRSLPASWFAPGKRTNVNGISIRLLKESEQFLKERYGSTWNTPAKYFEWRWPLADDI